jgi:hypothetical protein
VRKKDERLFEINANAADRSKMIAEKLELEKDFENLKESAARQKAQDQTELETERAKYESTIKSLEQHLGEVVKGIRQEVDNK